MRYWMGLVTLNLSMVVIIMLGVVRKASRTKRNKLITKYRKNQQNPRTERLFL